MKKIIVLLGLLSVVLGATLTLKATIRDFTPDTSNDFESSIIGAVTGLVKNTLDGDGKPQRSSLSVGCCTDNLNSWYRSVPGVNIEIPINITLDDSATAGLFTFESANFFPIDGLGFGNFGSFGHNFHFTTEISTTFTHQSSRNDVFTFIGDDDVWVFIDNKLAVDLGGVHGAITGSVQLNTLGLVDGTTYSLKVFHAERHTTQSNFKMQTTLALVPQDPELPETPVEDLCGVSYKSGCAQNNQCLEKVAPIFHHGTGFINSPFLGYNAVVFGNFAVATGDTEGRVAVGGKFSSTGGYSVGNSVVTTGANKILDPASFALVCGGDFDWTGSGSVEPLGNNAVPGYANPSDREITAIGGSAIHVPAGVETRAAPAGAAALASDFDYARRYYRRVSSDLAGLTPNAVASLAVGQAIKITCSSATADSYVINMDASIINQGTSWTLAGCNADAQFIFNIAGGAINFHGDNLHLPGEPVAIVKALYNVIGVGRTINVNTRVFGHIIAPDCDVKQNGGVIVGRVVVASYDTKGKASQINQPRCPTPTPPVNPPAPVCPYFENDFVCDLSLRLGGVIASFKDFNVVSFKDFNANTGDIEGRLITKGNTVLGNGFSIGALLDTTPSGHDRSLPTAAVVGGNCTWGSGAIFPDVPPAPAQGPQEGIFVKGTFTAPSFLLSRRVTGLVLDTLEDDFSRAFDCYSGISGFYSGLSSNVNTKVEYQGFHVTCNGPESEYVINVDGAVLSGITWYTTTNCVYGARYVINVVGNGDVTFGGDHFPAISGGVVYNVIGTGRTINVNTQVNGNLLAPGNILNQRGGVIVGKVVVADVQFSLQINKPNCPDDSQPEEIPIQVITPPKQGDDELEYDLGGDCVKPGDKIKFPDGKVYHVKKVNGKKCTFEEPITSPCAVGTRTIVQLDDAMRIRGPNTATTAAAGSIVASAVLVLFAVAALL